MHLLANPLNGRTAMIKRVSSHKRVLVRKNSLFALEANTVWVEQLKHALHFVRACVLQAENALDGAACAKGTSETDPTPVSAYASRPTHAETAPC